MKEVTRLEQGWEAPSRGRGTVTATRKGEKTIVDGPTPDAGVPHAWLHRESPVEWWFVQGCYQGPASGSRHFMATLLRLRRPGPVENRDAYSLLLSVVDPDTGHHERRSQVDRSAIDVVLGSAHQLREHTHLDASVVDAYLKELASCGPPFPIVALDTGPTVDPDACSAGWDDFHLSQVGQGFELGFVEPGSDRRCSFSLRPLVPHVHVPAIQLGSLEPIHYLTCPGLTLGGHVGGDPVHGQAWFDHQWGSSSWFVTDSGRRRLLGWEWWGISLQTGQHLLVTVHRDLERRRALGRWGVLIDRNGSMRGFDELSAVPLRYWESPATRIRYPVSWRLRIPALGADLRFDPFADDEEIPVLGVGRAIWEGAGRVSGHLDGQPVVGRGRFELHGRGYVFDLGRHIQGLAKRVERRIAEYLPRTMDEARLRTYVGKPKWKHDTEAYTAVLSRPVWDLMDRGGKHWRPIFGLLMLESLGVPSQRYELLVSVVSELPHTGALIIDDIEDQARLRRGSPCIHLRYGMDVAINAANTVYFLPYQLFPGTPELTPEQKLDLYRLMSERSVCSHLGQGADIYWSRHLTRSRLEEWMNDSFAPKILQTYAYKTGSIVQGTAEAACIVAAATGEIRRACGSFGRAFGVAFQIIDDILDFTGRPKERKQPGADLAGGKLTYVVFRALQRLPPRQRRRLGTILCSASLREDRATVQEGVDLVRNCGILEECEREALAMLEREWKQLSRLLRPSEPKVLLRAFCDTLLSVDGRG